MTSKVRAVVATLLAVPLLSACVSINSVSPAPAAPGDVVRLHLSNVIGPMSVEPGAKLTFDGKEMLLEPDTASVIGFVVPEGTADGTYTLEVRDGVGVLEVITILPLLRFRSDSATLVVGAE
jgi:hypothetical protein